VLLPQSPDAAKRRRSTGELLADLRGAKGLRPNIDRGLAGGLRAWLDDGVYERFGVVPRDTLKVSTRSFSPAASAHGGSTVLLRGALINQLVRLHAASATVTSPVNDAVEALRGSGRDTQLELLDSLDPDELSQLGAEVNAHYETLCDVLPRISSRWSPRCGVRQAVTLAGGGVVCRGLVDLALGTPGGTRACVCLIDVTTSVLGANHVRVCNYLALLETIRSGEQPVRVAAISTADGGSIVRDVTPELLAHAVSDLLDTIPLAAAA
jgi:hypothetical protein